MSSLTIGVLSPRVGNGHSKNSVLLVKLDLCSRITESRSQRLRSDIEIKLKVVILGGKIQSRL